MNAIILDENISRGENYAGSTYALSAGGAGRYGP